MIDDPEWEVRSHLEAVPRTIDRLHVDPQARREQSLRPRLDTLTRRERAGWGRTEQARVPPRVEARGVAEQRPDLIDRGVDFAGGADAHGHAEPPARTVLRWFGTDAFLPRVIDWSELKPGLGPHDLAYCLYAVPTADRPTRDQALLRRYWEGLQASGVSAYRWDLCSWDYRFSVITNLFQSVLQDSVSWFRKTAAVIADLDCLAELRGPPPMS